MESPFFGGVSVGGQRAWQKLREGFGLIDSEQEKRNATNIWWNDVGFFLDQRAGVRRKPESPEPDVGRHRVHCNCLPEHDSSERVVTLQDPDDVAGVDRYHMAQNTLSIGNLVDRIAGRATGSARSSAATAPTAESMVWRAVRTLASETGAYASAKAWQGCQDEVGSWSPQNNPKQSAMRNGPGGPYVSPLSPRGPGRHVRWVTQVNVREFVESTEELASRRKHWGGILQSAEQEACEAYYSFGKHRSDSRHRLIRDPWESADPPAGKELEAEREDALLRCLQSTLYMDALPEKFSSGEEGDAFIDTGHKGVGSWGMEGSPPPPMTDGPQPLKLDLSDPPMAELSAKAVLASLGTASGVRRLSQP